MMRMPPGGAVLLALSVLGCDDPESPPPEPCGASTSGCSARQHCDTIAIPHRCVCDAPYVGSGCSACAPGYRKSGSSCIATPVVCSERPCGSRGQCAHHTDGTELCLCKPEYTGNVCGTCTDGFQDNDQDGVCAPACGVADVYCAGLETCSDVSGEARCVCSPGFTGPGCLDCDVGYRRNPVDDSCVPTCEAEASACTENGQCVDTLRGARCACEPGYTGDKCESCSATHTVNDAGQCVAAVPENALLWTVAKTEKRSYLGVLQPPLFDFFPVVPVSEELRDVAYAPESDVLYGLRAGSPVTIDIETGELKDLLGDGASLGDSLARDAASGELYIASADVVWRLEPESQTLTEVARPGGVAIDFDEARRVLVGLTAGGERFELDPVDGARRTLSALPVLNPVAIAVHAAEDRAYVLGGLAETAEHKLRRFCEEIAEGLGVALGMRSVQAQFGSSLAAGEVRVLQDSGQDPPLIAYGSIDGTAQGGTLRIQTQHPDAVVCISTVRERLHVELDQNARFKLLLIISEEPAVSLDVASATGDALGTIQIHAGGDIPITGSLDQIVLHTRDEWQAHGLPTWSQFADRPTPMLGVVDWPSGGSVFSELDMPQPVGSLSFIEAP